jgi:hypothetical protein
VDLLTSLRRVKHRVMVLRKRLRPRAVAARDAAYRGRARLGTFVYDDDDYRDPRGYHAFDHFLDREAPSEMVSPDPLAPPRALYVLWTGDNEMSEARRSGMEAIRRINADLEVRLVTPDNLDEHLVPGHPLHPAYEHLSLVHRSDYLRCYFMHHVGGGYTDVKRPLQPWSPVWAEFEDPEVWMVGQPEVDSDLVANLQGRLGRDVRQQFSRLSINSSFVMRPQTPLTAEWYDEVQRRMDYYSRDLERFPAIDPMGVEGGYRVTWIAFQSQVLHPLQLKHLPHVRTDERLNVDLHAYR